MERNINTKKTKTNILDHLISDFESTSQGQHISTLSAKDFDDLILYYELEFIFDKALEVVEVALEHLGHQNDLLLKKARILVLLKDHTAAYETLEYLNAESANDNDVLLLKAQCMVAENNYDQAFALLKMPFRNGSSAEKITASMLKANIYEAQKDFNSMFGTIKYVLDKDPSNEAAMDKLWAYMESQRSYQQGIHFLNQLLDKDPYNYLAWFNLGQAYSCLGEYDNALSSYEYSYVINPDFEAGFRECAELAFELGKYKMALKVYLEILEIFGPDCDLFANIGICYLKLKQFKQARLNLRKAMRLDPYNDEVHYNLGMCFMSENKWEMGLQFFLRAISLEDSCEDYFVATAGAYYKLGDLDKANYYYIKATEKGSDQPEIWMEQVKFLYQIKEYQKALEVLEESETYTYSAELYYALTAVLIALDRKKEAMEQFKEALVDDFYAHRILFAFDKELSTDPEVTSVLHYYQPEE
ncbi:MAG TPA: tetratricopeptide repeat protein [Saprospiraceae bacterium]|nr:tetratricopeptide repeat protein [Saprospiraceae bacterium]